MGQGDPDPRLNPWLLRVDKLPLTTIFGRVSAIAAGAIFSMLGCGGAATPALNPASWTIFSGPPNLTSFLGVKFGEKLYRVQMELPDGSVETSPYGAECYRVEHVQAGAVRYESVLFEFTDNTGMQLLIGRFAPSSGAEVRSQLERALGQPNSVAPSKGHLPEETDVSRELPHNEQVIFKGLEHRVVVIGPAGGPLKPDLDLRTASDL